MFITYSNTFLNNLDLKKSRKFRLLFRNRRIAPHFVRVTSSPFDVIFQGALTSHAGVITSPRSKYMVSGYQPGWAYNLRAGDIVSHIQTLGYRE